MGIGWSLGENIFLNLFSSGTMNGYKLPKKLCMIEIYAKANACLSITRMSTRTCQWAGQPQGLMMMRAGQGRLWAEAGAVVTEQACLRLRPALHPSLPSFIIILFIVAILIIAMTIIIITITLLACLWPTPALHPSQPPSQHNPMPSSTHS